MSSITSKLRNIHMMDCYAAYENIIFNITWKIYLSVKISKLCSEKVFKGKKIHIYCHCSAFYNSKKRNCIVIEIG